MSLFSKTQQELLAAMLGAYGTFPVTGTNELSVRCLAFEADENSVISSVKDKDNQERINDIGWAGKTVKTDKVAFFGFEAYKITLASGSGQVYRTQPPFEQ